MNENDLSYLIRGAAFKVHSALGPGLLESVYEVALSHELLKINLEVKTQVGIPFIYDEIKFEFGFRLDMIVNDKVIIEIKATTFTINQNINQQRSYLKASKYEIGYLVNFGTLKVDIRRSIYTNDRKPFHVIDS